MAFIPSLSSVRQKSKIHYYDVSMSLSFDFNINLFWGSMIRLKKKRIYVVMSNLMLVKLNI